MRSKSTLQLTFLLSANLVRGRSLSPFSTFHHPGSVTQLPQQPAYSSASDRGSSAQHRGAESTGNEECEQRLPTPEQLREWSVCEAVRGLFSSESMASKRRRISVVNAFFAFSTQKGGGGRRLTSMDTSGCAATRLSFMVSTASFRRDSVPGSSAVAVDEEGGSRWGYRDW